MEISRSWFFILSLIILNAPNIRGDSYSFINEEEWVDPDSLSQLFSDPAWKTMGKESRFVTSVGFFCHILVSLQLLIRALFIYISFRTEFFFPFIPVGQT
jgi:hypothetical protein